MEEKIGFPLDLEGRMDALLNVINTEFKSLTVLHLDDIATSGYEIRKKIVSTISDDELLPMGCSFDSYCRETLFPIGIVAKDKILYNGKVGYSLTEDGYKYGLPVAAFALDWSYLNEKSLFEVLGSTSSSGGVRSPLQRAKFLKFLDENGVSSWRKVMEFLNLFGSSYTNHVIPLCKTGFISGLSGEPSSRAGNPYYLIGIPERFNEFTLPRISKKVVSYLADTKSVGVGKMSMDIKEDQGAVSRALGHLFESGYVGNQLNSRQRGCENLDLKLEGEGRRFLDNFIYPIEEALSNDLALGKMRETHETIVSDANIFREYGLNGCKKYRSVSPRLSHAGNTVDRVYGFVLNNPGSRPKEIAEALGLKKVDNALTVLRKKEKVIFEKDGTSSHYFVI